ncbi:Cerato-platanin [Trametes sanguinea]|nr:Cerato-platanin [Trametes sanguinea]
MQLASVTAPSPHSYELACSDGANGLIAQGFTTLGSLPSFPTTSSAAAIGGLDSSECGTCWELAAYQGGIRIINVLATGIDHADDGFNIALAALNTFTHSQAVS